MTTCPVGSVITFSGKSCRSLTDLDVRKVYYPFLILTALCAIISWIGKIAKPNHLVLTNFVIMLGLIEHLAILAQIAFTFIFGTYLMAILIIAIWLGYILTLIMFNVLWRNQIVKKDASFASYRLHSDNIVSTRVRSVLAAVVSWRFQKLLYSHFFGLHINPFKFSDQTAVKNLIFKTTIANVALTFLPLCILNVYGLLMSSDLMATQL